MTREKSVVRREVTYKIKSYMKDLGDAPERQDIIIYTQNFNTVKKGKRVVKKKTAMNVLRAENVPILCLSKFRKNFDHPVVKVEVDKLLSKMVLGKKSCVGRN